MSKFTKHTSSIKFSEDIIAIQIDFFFKPNFPKPFLNSNSFLEFTGLVLRFVLQIRVTDSRIRELFVSLIRGEFVLWISELVLRFQVWLEIMVEEMELPSCTSLLIGGEVGGRTLWWRTVVSGNGDAAICFRWWIYVVNELISIS